MKDGKVKLILPYNNALLCDNDWFFKMHLLKLFGRLPQTVEAEHRHLSRKQPIAHHSRAPRNEAECCGTCMLHNINN